MKRIMITVLLLLAFNVNAQQTGSRYQDSLAPAPASPHPAEVNRANKIEGIKSKSDGEIEAEKEAKDKGSNKNQTQVHPNKIAPARDTLKLSKPR